VKWSCQTFNYTGSAPANSGAGVVYAGSADEYIYAMNADGSLRFRYWAGSSAGCSPAIGPDGTVYVTAYDGYLVALPGSGPLAETPWPMFYHDAQHSGRAGGP